ncbi:stage III sporulation protein AG [Paenibacillus mucilaginosus]|nr:stage III sporulation protein AG [Paenibacillus mucilaginosus]AEI41230.1 mutants block sporulation after engulfment [Paenibacillus mucilaginosus KNP414]AFH61968.1 stage III sporulation protein AG [Paenibacillus mucilaginosus K02]MCG7211347.1 stage III sporulation protein AG [Paenibacillus mucilaginosus]WDM30268.1 stage III sporulation protein AG [Paenibacillus mucilaginosus]WFA18450.1 stage III sporulation protein AG [Paenibacillus mucilaginosus]
MGTGWKGLGELLGGGPGGPKRMQTLRWLLLMGLVGAAFMILNSFITVKDVDTPDGARASPPSPADQPVFSVGKERSPFREYEESYQTQLKEMLTKMVGVGEVEVMVTIESTEEIVVQENRKDVEQVTNEKDHQGSTRHITEINKSGEVVIYEVSGGKQPLITKTIKPKVRGVLVIAKGAENLTVKKMISEAVERGLEVPPHRISILPRKS